LENEKRNTATRQVIQTSRKNDAWLKRKKTVEGMGEEEKRTELVRGERHSPL